jgi:hypothetical protein
VLLVGVWVKEGTGGWLWFCGVFAIRQSSFSHTTFTPGGGAFYYNSGLTKGASPERRGVGGFIRFDGFAVFPRCDCYSLLFFI